MCERDLGPIKGGHNNFILFFILLVFIFVKMTYILRFLKHSKAKYFFNNVIPLTPKLLVSLEEFTDDHPPDEHYSFKNDTIYNMPEFFDCINSECIPEQCITCLSVIVDIFLLMILVYFLYFAKKIYVRRSKKSEFSLTSLFEQQENVCVKCRLLTDENTQHCLVCNSCVRNWDHHCFWLNTCISAENKRQFLMFLYSMLVFIIVNTIFFSTNIYLFFVSKNLFYVLIFHTREHSFLYYLSKISWITGNGYLLLLSVYSLFFMLIPILKNNCKKDVIERTLSKYQADLISKKNDNTTLNTSTNSDSYSI